MPRLHIVIENPILNTRLEAPARHFRFDDEGITDQVVDEDAWAALCSTVSRPFSIPETGKIAIKVINHYGDEVLQVYEVAPS